MSMGKGCSDRGKGKKAGPGLQKCNVIGKFSVKEESRETMDHRERATA